MLPKLWSECSTVRGESPDIKEIFGDYLDPHLVDLNSCRYIGGPLTRGEQLTFNRVVKFRRKLGLKLSIGNARKILRELRAY